MHEYGRRDRDVTLVEVLDRVVDRGVVLTGDITISVADVDLIYLGLRVALRTPLHHEKQAVSEGVDDADPRVRGRPNPE